MEFENLIKDFDIFLAILKENEDNLQESNTFIASSLDRHFSESNQKKWQAIVKWILSQDLICTNNLCETHELFSTLRKKAEIFLTSKDRIEYSLDTFGVYRNDSYEHTPYTYTKSGYLALEQVFDSKKHCRWFNQSYEILNNTDEIVKYLLEYGQKDDNSNYTMVFDNTIQVKLDYHNINNFTIFYNIINNNQCNTEYDSISEPELESEFLSESYYSEEYNSENVSLTCYDIDSLSSSVRSNPKAPPPLLFFQQPEISDDTINTASHRLMKIQRVENDTFNAFPMTETEYTGPITYYYYPEFNPLYKQDSFAIAQKYYDECFSWSPDVNKSDKKNIQDFLEKAGYFSYILAHQMPVKRGNSSILELIVKNLANQKGIILPLNFKNNNIGWDFKAFTTPSIKQYATWYAENVYELNDITLNEKYSEQFTSEFSIGESLTLR